MTENYTIKGCLVKDHIHHRSYQLTNRIDAEKLYHTLVTYENTRETNQQIEDTYDRISKQFIQIRLTLGTLQEEIQQLEAKINELNNR